MNSSMSPCWPLKHKKYVSLGITEGMYKVSLTAFLKPKYAPMKVRGTEMQNQRANMATRVPNGMAAEEPSPHKIRFITKKSANTTLSTDATLRNGRLNERHNYMDL